MYESVNICAWQRKCVFDLAARHSKHTLGWCVCVCGSERTAEGKHTLPLAAEAGLCAEVNTSGGCASVWRNFLWNLLQPFILSDTKEWSN